MCMNMEIHCMWIRELCTYILLLFIINITGLIKITQMSLKGRGIFTFYVAFQTGYPVMMDFKSQIFRRILSLE